MDETPSAASSTPPPQIHTSMEKSPLERAVEACQRGDEGMLDEALSDGVLASATDADGCSLLHWASINNHASLVQKLIQGGADPNYLGGLLVSSPLHWAARVGAIQAIGVLVPAGARCDVRDTQGYTPMHLAVQQCFSSVVAYFLAKYDYSMNVTDNTGMTPVMWAAYRTYEMFPLRLLVRAGAELSAKEHLQGNTALHFATQERNISAVKELLQSEQVDVMAKNNQQETPLDIARNMRNTNIIKMMEKAARRNHQMSSSCCDRLRDSERIVSVLQLFLPGLLLLLFAVLFHTVHPIIATALLIVTAVILKFFSYDFHQLTHSYVPVGITAAEATAVILSWSAYGHWWVPWWAQVIFVIFSLTLIYSFAKVSLGDPGVIPPSDNPSEELVRLVEDRSLGYFCFSCFVNRPPGSKHCSVCDKCVTGFDHHCPWLAACITKRNHRDFLLFVFSVFAVSTTYFIAVAFFFAYEMHQHTFVEFLLDYPWIVFSAALSLVHTILMSSLFFMQCSQIMEGQTTNDRIKRHRQRQHGHSPTQGSDESSKESDTTPYVHQPFGCSDRIRNVLNFCAGAD